MLEIDLGIIDISTQEGKQKFNEMELMRLFDTIMGDFPYDNEFRIYIPQNTFNKLFSTNTQTLVSVTLKSKNCTFRLFSSNNLSPDDIVKVTTNTTLCGWYPINIAY